MDLDYNIDFVGHIYEINIDPQHRFHVFIYQIMDDIYNGTHDHQSKLLGLVYIHKTIKKMLSMNVVLTPRMDHDIMTTINKIIMKHVYNEYRDIEYSNIPMIDNMNE